MNYNFFNAINENIIVYNGEFLSDDIKESVTRSVENLFNQCKSIYDQKVYRSNHCIWYILSKNIPEYYVIMSLKNLYAKAINKEILKNALIAYPNILQNIPVPSTSVDANMNALNKSYFTVPHHFVSFNFLQDLSKYICDTKDNYHETFDLLG